MDLFLCPAWENEYLSHLGYYIIQDCHPKECVIAVILGSKEFFSGHIK